MEEKLPLVSSARVRHERRMLVGHLSIHCAVAAVARNGGAKGSNDRGGALREHAEDLVALRQRDRRCGRRYGRAAVAEAVQLVQ
eukprot:213899-Prymnesium_polylepis.2